MAKPNDGCIGLSKKSFKVGKVNTFIIFGEDIAPPPPAGAPPVLPNIYLSGRNHVWKNPTLTRKHEDGIKVEVRCVKRKKSAAQAPVSGDGDDDLTVTIVFDEGGGGGQDEVIAECCFEDVVYDG